MQGSPHCPHIQLLPASSPELNRTGRLLLSKRKSGGEASDGLQFVDLGIMDTGWSQRMHTRFDRNCLTLKDRDTIARKFNKAGKVRRVKSRD